VIVVKRQLSNFSAISWREQVNFQRDDDEIVVCPFVLFLLAIVLSVLLRYTDSDYPFGIFKLFFYFNEIAKNTILSEQIREQVNFQRDDDEVRFILDKHA
jgi:hypothetical protein